MDLSKKRILITQPMLHWICGSAVVTLELATYLQSIGAKVSIYTCFYDDPMRTICQKNHLEVFTPGNAHNLKLTDFDVIWVHSQILPQSIAKDLGKKLPKTPPAFIFLHMSGMDWIPDEKPWIYDLENRLSSKSLFISEEVQSVSAPLLDKKIATDFFRNPAPIAFSSRKTKPKQPLKDLLIVSNHPPREVLEAKNILEQKYGLNVQLLGEKQSKYELFSPKLLEQFDAIITIAKTTQYCLVSSTPVYIYDSFSGGVGWLNADNFKKAKFRNFSGYQNSLYPNYTGDGFKKKLATTIAKEIVEGYDAALDYQAKQQANFIKEFSIENVIPTIFADLKPRADLKPFDEKYLETVLAAEAFAEKRFEASSILYNYTKAPTTPLEKLSALENRNRELEAAFSAKSYKLYEKFILPLVHLKTRKK